MPHYGYRCSSCQREFEVVQRMIDPPQAACPECAGAGKRLFYPAGILFKGSGFYKTDSRPGDPPPPKPDGAKTEGAKPSPGPAKDSPAPTAPTSPPPPKPAAAPAPAGASSSD